MPPKGFLAPAGFEDGRQILDIAAKIKSPSTRTLLFSELAWPRKSKTASPLLNLEFSGNLSY